MTWRPVAEFAAVAASAPVTLATGGFDDTVISLAVGIVGVWLARIVFVNRENRRLDTPLTHGETIPVTLAACLIAGTIIWDQELGISAAAFTGLGVGWTTVILLEFFGDRILSGLRVMLGGEHRPITSDQQPIASEIFPDVPEDMADLLHKADDADPDYKPPSK